MKSISCLGTRLSFSYKISCLGQCILIAAPPRIRRGISLSSASWIIRRISFSKSVKVANSPKQQNNLHYGHVCCFMKRGLCSHISQEDILMSIKLICGKHRNSNSREGFQGLVNPYPKRVLLTPDCILVVRNPSYN